MKTVRRSYLDVLVGKKHIKDSNTKNTNFFKSKDLSLIASFATVSPSHDKNSIF